MSTQVPWLYYTIGQHVWGRSPTLLGALKNAAYENPAAEEFVALYAHPDSRVSPIDGSLEYPADCKPIKIGWYKKTGRRFYVIEDKK